MYSHVFFIVYESSPTNLYFLYLYDKYILFFLLPKPDLMPKFALKDNKLNLWGGSRRLTPTSPQTNVHLDQHSKSVQYPNVPSDQQNRLAM